MTEEEIKELMQRRIRQILVHSCIYYRFNNNIIDDFTYDRWGNELIDLIKQYPEYLKELEHGEAFTDYVEMASGFNLPYNSPEIVYKAQHLLKIQKVF